MKYDLQLSVSTSRVAGQQCLRPHWRTANSSNESELAMLTARVTECCLRSLDGWKVH